MAVDLTELDRLLAEATRGPWRALPGTFTGRANILHASKDDESWTDVPIVVSHYYSSTTKPDFALIAALRNAAPELIAAARERDALKAERDAARDEVARMREGLAEARGLLERVEKYVVEDRASTPGTTRLARVHNEIRAWLAANREGK